MFKTLRNCDIYISSSSGGFSLSEKIAQQMKGSLKFTSESDTIEGSQSNIPTEKSFTVEAEILALTSTQRSQLTAFD